MSSLFLARLQFGFAAGFHFLFPPTTLGLSLVILILESLYLAKKQAIYRDASSFLVKLLGIVFVMGAATGIALEFAFGNNWSAYSRMVGDVFGAPLAAEGVLAFFLESVFLGILIFGRRRVRATTYWLSSVFVFIGAHLSGVWIIIANSWMQTPAGYRLDAGRAVLTDFAQAALNPSTIVRFVHVVLGGWITGSLLIAAAAAWWLLRNKAKEKALLILKTSLSLFIISALLQLISGHVHSYQVTKSQPEKMAAFEALWQTQNGAAFTVFGIPDANKEKTYAALRIPKLLSLLAHFDREARIAGLNEFPKNERPPVFIPFAGYHLMILLGLLFIVLALAGVIFLARRANPPARWYLRCLIAAVPLPYLANEFGWIAAEVGRQPWAVYKVLRTAAAVSPTVPAGNILFSLIIFVLIYALVGLAGISIIVKMIRTGPGTVPSAGHGGR